MFYFSWFKNTTKWHFYIVKLSNKDFTYKYREYIEPALHNCDFLESLINDILYFTKEEFDEEPKMVY